MKAIIAFLLITFLAILANSQCVEFNCGWDVQNAVYDCATALTTDEFDIIADIECIQGIL